MPEKRRRLAVLRAIIAGRRVRRQDELQRLLAERGVPTTQATISRDLREIGVLKGPDGYTLPETGGTPPRSGALERALAEYLVSARPAGTLVVVRTGPGQASALALALDRAEVPGVVGTVAGDDTIFVATADEAEARRVAEGLQAGATRPAD